MCGICGIIDFSGHPILKPELQAMNNLASHRGPDGEGYYLNNNIGLGHRRLAIIDLSELGHQPFVYRTPSGKRLVLVFNGEIYNYLELKKTLEHAGYSFSSQTDTEVILAAYDHWGKNCVARFNGMWAFAIYDELETELFCSRDRFGIKPFYCTVLSSKFCFASEIKQFKALTAWQPKLNKVRTWEFLQHGYHAHTEETLFDGIQQLPPATNLVVNVESGKTEKTIYYSVGQVENQRSFSSQRDCLQSFSSTFWEAIRLHLRADVKVGTSFSGGLDSSAIVSVIHDIGDGLEQSTVSAVFPGYDRDESQYIDELCQDLHLKNLKVSPTFFSLTESLERLVWHQDEPFSSASIFAQFVVYQKSSQIGLKVMLDGQGADEILGGYDKFYAPYLKKLGKKNPLLPPYIILNLLMNQSTIFQNLWRRLTHSWFNQAHPINITQPSFSPKQERIFRRSADDTMRNSSINLLREVGLPMLLRYQDRNSMAHSVESRVPFLDYRLVELCMALPDELKIKCGLKKYVLRKTMEKTLPQQILNRRDKYAFEVPEINWIREQRAWFRQQLTEATGAHPSVLSPSTLVYLDNLVASKHNDYGPIWRVITFHKWAHLFGVDSQC